jgi:hypothetical protein
VGKLTDLRLPEATIKVSDGSFTVRGLSFSDLSSLMATHASAISLFFSNAMTKFQQNKVNPEDIGLLAQEAIREFPGLVSAIIAVAADEDTPEGHAMAARLGATVQIEALEQIVILTIVSEAELKKVIEIVTRGTVKLNDRLGRMALSQPPGGSGGSGAM